MTAARSSSLRQMMRARPWSARSAECSCDRQRPERPSLDRAPAALDEDDQRARRERAAERAAGPGRDIHASPSRGDAAHDRLDESVAPSADPGELLLPQWRGRLHKWAFFAALPLGVLLLVMAERTAARAAVAVYVVCLTAGFGVSAAYHRLARSAAARRRLRRLDHSLIFVVI